LNSHGSSAVVMLSWEFPPRIVGGIAPHVYDLSRALARRGNDVYVVTCDFPGARDRETIGGVNIIRVDSYRFPTPDFATWASMMNMNMKLAGAELMKSLGGRVLLHAHDWLVANACIGLKHMFRRPLVATIHSTEYGRRNGLHDDYQRLIHSTEAWLCREAWRVICCSRYMASQVSNVLGVPHGKVDVIVNATDPSRFEGPYDRDAFRARFAASSEKIVLYVGRLVHEKGVELLVDSIPLVLKSVDTKFVIVGEGYMKERLIKRMQELGIGGKTFFTGFLDDITVRLLFRTADVFVVPSLYEPFGIVALEAMAAMTPVVTTGVGGLGEIVEHNLTGVKVYPSPESLAWGILQVLTNPDLANKLRMNAYRRVLSEFSWERIAEETEKLYQRVMDEYEAGVWKPDLPDS
jgi:glycogen(starch) synthase